MTSFEIYEELGAGGGETFHSTLARFEDGKTMVVELINDGDRIYSQAFLYDENYDKKRTEIARTEEWVFYFKKWEIEYNGGTYQLDLLKIPDSILNKNVQLRDEIIFGKYEPEKYIGGIRRFENLSVEKLKKLAELNFIELNEYQNYSPTVQVFIEFMEKYQNYTVMGYTVSIERSDYRVSLDGIEKKSTAESETEKEEFKELFGNADEFESDSKMYAWFD